jgi:hypothetical protein
MNNVTYYLSAPNSHIGYKVHNGQPVEEARYAIIETSNIRYVGIETPFADVVRPEWVECSRDQYESIRADALNYLGLWDVSARHLAQIEEAEQQMEQQQQTAGLFAQWEFEDILAAMS